MRIPRDSTGYAAALQSAFPDMGRVAPLQVLGEGFRSVVLETPDGVVVRVGRTPEAARGYRTEARLLPRLRSRLPVAIPEPRWHTGPSPSFPHGAIGYPKLPGVPLSPERLFRLDSDRLATELAAFLVALHGIPAAELDRWTIPVADTADSARSYLETALPPLRTALSTTEYQRVMHWRNGFLTDEVLRRYPPALRHGDLWYENLLVDEESGRLVGVLDFEELAIGDPAQDLATQLHLGEDFARRVPAAYRAAGGRSDDSLTERIPRLWELRHFDGLAFAVRHDDHDEFDDEVRKLRGSSVLDAAATLSLA